MIQVTNDTHDFFEKHNEEILIYGAGNAGYWIGHYMNRCGLDYSGYIDKKLDHEDVTYNDKPVYTPDKLKEYRGRSLRIIVSPHNYENVLADLLWMEHLYEFNALCLVPRYKHISTKEEGYHINKLLSYFRRKLFKGEVPTVISNNCAAGFIYDLMDMIMISPTINTGIVPDDFIKLCQNPEYYLNKDMDNELYFIRPYGNPQLDDDVPAGKIKDITVQFGHVDSTEGLVDRWNMMRKRVNWNRIIYVYCTHDVYVPFSVANEKAFMSLPREHLLIVMRNAAFWDNSFTGNGFNKVFMQQNYLASPDSAIENYFDLLGWINGEGLN